MKSLTVCLALFSLAVSGCASTASKNTAETIFVNGYCTSQQTISGTADAHFAAFSQWTRDHELPILKADSVHRVFVLESIPLGTEFRGDRPPTLNVTISLAPRSYGASLLIAASWDYRPATGSIYGTVDGLAENMVDRMTRVFGIERACS